MANGNGRWRGRGGGDRETDARPGSEGSSRSYDIIYNRRGESEISFRPETSIQILRDQQARVQAEAINARLSAQSRVDIFPAVGKFVIPPAESKDTWAAHAELVKDKTQNLVFNPERYAYFDKIIADKLNLPALTDENHPDYAKYEALRNNLAVLRNDIIGIYMDDASFDPGDEVHIPKIAGIAAAIGNGLKNDRWYKRPFAPSISLDVANVEAIGAREIYKYLLAQQTRSAGAFENLRRRIKDFFGMPDQTWGLPAIETTPFSDAGLAAPPPPHKECYTADELVAACTKEAGDLVGLSTDTTRIAGNLRSLDTIETPPGNASIEEAKRTLRFLRNLQLGDRDIVTWLDNGAPAEEVAKAQSLKRLVEIYSGELRKVTRVRPESFYNIVVEDASEAAGAIAMGMSMHAANSLPQGHPEIARLDARIEAMPEIWEHRSRQSVHRLLDTIEAGLMHTMGADLNDKSPADRLVEMSERIRATATRLRRAHEMDRPAREESIELAREILRKLKNIQFNDKPIDELLKAGTAANNAEFAQKIDEMVETYQSLLAEAVQHNPNIAGDPRVMQANEAVGNFAHAVSLMAAKEIPADMAAAQQISADIAQMPQEWKNMENRTVNRLAQAMEGGFEQAVGDLEMQRQERQKQDEEIVQDAAAMAMQSRRRKRRRSASSGLGAGAQRKIDRDIKADDLALNQGRFRDAPLPSQQIPRAEQPRPQIRVEDLAAVESLGGNLRNIGNQTANLNPTDVKPDDKIVPNDQGAASFVQNVREQKIPRGNKPSGNRNNNPNGPNNQRPQRV